MPGELRLFAGTYTPEDWANPKGQEMVIPQNPRLYRLFGMTYGGRRYSTFALPSLPSLRSGQQEVPYIMAQDTDRHVANGRSPWGFVGEVRLWAGMDPPEGWLPCDGRDLAVTDYPALFAHLGSTYGGDGQATFKLPELPADGDIRYVINVNGVIPKETTASSRSANGGLYEFEPLLGEVRLFAGNYVPAGWRACDGQTYAIKDDPALFAILSARFGGDNRATFAVPALTFEANPDLTYAIASQGQFPSRP